MSPSTLRRAIGAVKDQTSIGLAMVGNSTSLADLDVAIVKATRHDEYPAEEKHLKEILSLTCYSRAFISACVNTLSRRLSKTSSWTVALKTLILIQRLLSDGDPDCIKVYDIFCRVGKQYDELDLFYSWSKSVGIARSTEYPEIERVTTKKLEVMDQYIRDKAQHKKLYIQEENNEEEEPEEDMNAIKALPAPEYFNEEPEEVKEETKEEDIKEEKLVQTEGDLLNLGDDMVTSQEHGDSLALALFDGALPTSATQALPWHAFDDAADWETALVQSSSNLSNQKPSLGGGFDTLLLDGMYRQAATNMQRQSHGMNGSASSVALGSAGRPAMLALPAPPTSGSGSSLDSADPFAASLAVAPPACHFLNKEA